MLETTFTETGFRAWNPRITECVGEIIVGCFSLNMNFDIRYRDGVTPNQDFIISPHPESRRLYIAGGGSFHGWKFLANIGKYVTQMLNGELEQGLAKKWAWNRSDEGAACATYAPTRDLNDIASCTEDKNQAQSVDTWIQGKVQILVN